MSEEELLLKKAFLVLSDFLDNKTPYPQGDERNQLMRNVLGEYSGCVVFAEEINDALEPITNEIYEALKTAGVDV